MSFVAVVHDDHLTCNGVEYFRGGAASVSLGAYGEKKASGSEYLAVHGSLPAPKLAVRSATAVAIDLSRSPALRDAAAYDALRTEARRLVRLEMTLADVKAAVNGTPPALRNLKSYGWEARVAHQIFVIVEASLADTLTRASSLGVAHEDGVLVLTAHARGGATRLMLPAEMTCAYLLCRPNWNTSRTAAERFTDDPWSRE